MRGSRLLAVLLMVGAMVVLTPGVAEAASRTNCNGSLAAGRYRHVVVLPNAVCFAETGVVINEGLEVRQGATFLLGDEGNPVPTGIIRGGVHSINAANVQIHFTTITGGVDLRGGSGAFFAGSPFCFPDCITWNTIEDSAITGDVAIVGYDGFWQGFIRNRVAGNMTFKNNVLEDSDGNEVVTNTIVGSLRCSGNNPAPQVGDSEGTPNLVSGRQLGQCRPNPT